MSTIQRLWDGSNSIATAGMTYNDDGSSSHVLIDKTKFKIAAPPDRAVLTEKPAEIVRDAVAAHNKLAMQTHSADTNPNLSTTGRQNALLGPQKIAVHTIGQLAVDLAKFQVTVDRREAALYAVPQINPSSAGEAIRDWETRTWFAAQPEAKRLDYLQLACSQPSTGDHLIAALLRGPFPEGNPDIKLAREMWQRARRAGNVTEAEAIDIQRDAAEWAYAQLAMLAAMVMQLCSTWGKPNVLNELLQAPTGREDASLLIFGFNQREIATSRRAVIAKAVLAA